MGLHQAKTHLIILNAVFAEIGSHKNIFIWKSLKKKLRAYIADYVTIIEGEISNIHAESGIYVLNIDLRGCGFGGNVLGRNYERKY